MSKTSLMMARTSLCALAIVIAKPIAAQNFSPTVQPSSVTLIPRKTASRVVSPTPLWGFTTQEALAFRTLAAADTLTDNHLTPVTNLFNSPALLLADIGITLAAAPDPVQISNQLTYTLVIQNSGPVDVADVVVTDSLPVSVNFVNASTSQGSATAEGSGLRWDAGPLTNGGIASATITVTPTSVGVITNTAIVAINSTSVIDPNPDNDFATIVTRVNGPGVPTLSVQILGSIVFDRQTGLFEQPVEVSNPGANPVPAIQLAVQGLTSGVILYNASGVSNGVPFVEYDQELDPGASASFILEYYVSNRADFVSTNFAATVISASSPTAPAGTIVQLDREPFLYDGKLVIEFIAIPGATYSVQYTADMQTWNTALPPIIATSTRVQWVDSGPPKTPSVPGGLGQRFYRVIQSP